MIKLLHRARQIWNYKSLDYIRKFKAVLIMISYFLDKAFDVGLEVLSQSLESFLVSGSFFHISDGFLLGSEFGPFNANLFKRFIKYDLFNSLSVHLGYLTTKHLG